MITITNKEFHELAEYIRTNYGINLKEEKKVLLTGRLQQVLLSTKCTSFTEYFRYITQDKTGEAAVVLLNKITTNHTFFMREADHFEYFQNKVLPYWKQRLTEKDLRIWCAASSTGEEPYTLAMLIDNFLGEERFFWDSRLLATDISEQVLKLAIKGIYSKERIDPLPPLWRQKYFVPYGTENMVVCDRIKQQVIFRKFNLMEEVFPFKRRFHVIFCRNVMIYFNQETKNQLISKLLNHLEPGGFLFIGHSESLDRMKYKVEYVMPSVYKKMEKE
ncbi:MAG: chemotaxis protein methyltransferase CheR [Clostridiales bacterium]|nr:chemotaxis protein methyltransferase CheR [Clostridiales bacterium]